MKAIMIIKINAIKNLKLLTHQTILLVISEVHSAFMKVACMI